MSLSFIFVTTWRSILSGIDLVVLPLAISFIIRTFSLSARSFSRPLLLEICETNSVDILFCRGTPGF